MPHMKKETLIIMIKRILKTDADLEFLLKLTVSELETIMACIRDHVEN